MLSNLEKIIYERVDNAQLNHSEAKAGKTHIDANPMSVMLPIGETCNFNCQMCMVDRENNPSCSNLSLERFKEFEPIIKNAISVSLYDKGEPFTNPDYEKIIDYIVAKHPGLLIYLSTNGLLLDSYWRTKFTELQYACVNVSINAGTQSTYAKIMGKDKFPNVLYNIREFVKERGGNELPQITLSYVLQKDSVYELPLFMSIAADLGVDSVSIWGLIQYTPRHKEFAVTEKDLTHIYLEAKEIADRNNLPIVTFSDIPYFDIQGYDTTCRDPWTSARVTAEGDVYTCCYNRKTYGNIFKQSFDEIWNSPEYQELRATVNTTDKLLEACKKCPRKLKIINGSSNVRL